MVEGLGNERRLHGYNREEGHTPSLPVVTRGAVSQARSGSRKLLKAFLEQLRLTLTSILKAGVLRPKPVHGAQRPGNGDMARSALGMAIKLPAATASAFGETTLLVSVDGRAVDGPESTVPVTAASRVVLYRRQGPALDVLTRGVIRRICLN